METADTHRPIEKATRAPKGKAVAPRQAETPHKRFQAADEKPAPHKRFVEDAG